MKICPKCGAENALEGALFCNRCGASLNSGETDIGNKSLDDEKNSELDFVVTETQAPNAPDFLGTINQNEADNGSADKENSIESEEQELEISSTAELLSDDTFTPPKPPEPEPDEFDFGELAANSNEPEEPQPEKKPVTPPVDWNREVPANGNELTELAARRLEEEKDMITRRFDNPPDPPKQEEKETKFDTEAEPIMASGTVRPVIDPAKQVGVPKSGQKIRGIAYFRKNIIQIVGNPFIHDGDELVINNKLYLLRTKRLSRNATIGLFAAALVILLLVVASQFINSPLSGDGSMVGMVLDGNQQPYLEGARVTLLPLNKTTKTNAQGFFRFDLIPTGTYEVVYELGDDFIGRGHSTVSAGQTTLVTFKDLEPMALAEKKNNESQIESVPPKKSGGTATSKSTSSKKSAKKSSGYGKLKLDANVDGARFLVDGEVLGAGNNTYSKIKSGQHKVTVEKAGYSKYTEIVTLKKNKTLTITANLDRLAEEKAPELTANDYLNMGRDAVRDNKFDLAIEDFGKAIALQPGDPDAYIERGKVYAMKSEAQSAAVDYIRAGEIYRMGGQEDRAVDAFSTALGYSPESINALVGRAGARLDDGQYRSSLADYEEALDIDKKFYPALYGAGLCQFKLGSHKKAEKYFKKAYEVDNSDPYLYQYMMLTYLARDDINKMRDTYAEFKATANPAELAAFKSSSRFEPVLRLIKEENR